MGGKFALVLLLVGLVVISAGCIGGGGENGSTQTQTTSSPTQSSTQLTSTTSSTTSHTTTTSTAITTTTSTSAYSIPKVSIDELGDYVGKNVSVEGLLLGLSYDSGNHVYVISVGENGTKINVTAKRELLSVINPIDVGVGSTILVTGKVESPDQISAGKIELVEKATPNIVEIKDLSSDMVGMIVVVEGNILSVKEIGSNLTLTISDGTCEIEVRILGSVVDGLDESAKAQLKEGLGVKVGGYLDEHNGKLEVIPYIPEAIIAYGEPLQTTTTTTTTTTTSEEMTTTTTTTTTASSIPTTTTTTTTTTAPPTQPGPQWVTVSDLSSASGVVQLNATWLKLYYSKPNYLLEVSDDTGRANLTVERTLLPNPIEAGTGSVLHLVVNASSMTVLNLSVVSPQPSPLLSTADITYELMGTTVIVEGTVSNFQTIGSNLKFLVVDDSGSITIFVPASVASKLPEDVRSGLQEGASVKISGYVTEYRGTIEVIPYSVEGIEVLT